jgi:hypothetical protein
MVVREVDGGTEGGLTPSRCAVRFLSFSISIRVAVRYYVYWVRS